MGSCEFVMVWVGCVGEGCLIDVWVELGSGAGLVGDAHCFLDWWVPGSVIAVKTLCCDNGVPARGAGWGRGACERGSR